MEKHPEDERDCISQDITSFGTGKEKDPLASVLCLKIEIFCKFNKNQNPTLQNVGLQD